MPSGIGQPAADWRARRRTLALPLLRAAPDAYLNGCIAEACDYLDDDRRSAKYAGKRDAALQQIITNGMRARWGSGPLMVRAG